MGQAKREIDDVRLSVIRSKYILFSVELENMANYYRRNGERTLGAKLSNISDDLKSVASEMGDDS